VLLLLCVGSEAKFSVRTQSMFASSNSNSTGAPDQTGNTLWLFHMSTNNLLAHANYYQGSTWQNDVYVSGTSPVYFAPSAVVFNNGFYTNIYVFYRDSYGGLFVPSSLSWTEIRLAAAGTVYVVPVGVVFGNTLYVFYLIAGYAQYQYLSTTDGVTWSTTAQQVPRLVGGCTFGNMPATIVDASFNHVLWLWYADPTGGLNYITFDGSQWGSWTGLPSSVITSPVGSMPTAVNYQGSIYIYFGAAGYTCYVQQTASTTFLPTACTPLVSTNQISAVTYTAANVPHPGVYVFWQCGNANNQYCYTYCSICSDSSQYSSSTLISSASVYGGWWPSPVVY